jgi:hypothetical protein
MIQMLELISPVLCLSDGKVGSQLCSGGTSSRRTHPLEPMTNIQKFFGGGDEANIAAAILVVLSSTGSMISVAYTCVRGEQPFTLVRACD